MPFYKIILIVLELMLLAVFVIPVFLEIVNAGNIAGILVSVILLLATFFWDRFYGFIQNICTYTGGKIITVFAAFVICLGTGFAAFLSVKMINAANNAPEEPVTAVVLGCHVKGTKPSLMLTRRLEAACEYLKENPDVKCVVTGGQGTGEDITEAEAMKQYLMEKGIEGERILKEDRSVNTDENLAFTKTVLEQNGLSNDIVVITDGFHQYRASLIAEKQGLESYSISCETRTDLVPTYWVREWFALAKEMFLK
ncbi:MAG: YdcF family protein [Oscillospiraceae bacterium]|nr:YdcF family protein [Oscillospiraceae bacterium]